MKTLNGGRTVHDARNDLVFEFFRMVRGLRPKTIMLENVPGLANDNRFSTLVQELRLLGYHVKHKTLDAADYGVPQRRRRLILVAGYQGDVHFGRATRKRRTVRDAIGNLPKPGKSGDAIHDFPESRSDHIQSLIKAIPPNGGSRKSLPSRFKLNCHKRFNGFNDVYGRMSWSDVAPTITGGCINPSKGRFLHPKANRAITPREAALLQTFPRRYKFATYQGKYAIAQMIGNALPPEFIRRNALGLKRFALSYNTHTHSNGCAQ
jgi:DNA (cytosine-5)-methyltransferase 1